MGEGMHLPLSSLSPLQGESFILLMQLACEDPFQIYLACQERQP